MAYEIRRLDARRVDVAPEPPEPTETTPAPSFAAGAANLPDYVEWPQEPFPDPPYTLGMENRRSSFESHGFPIPVDDPQALTDLCERYLNGPLKTHRFEPVGRDLLVTLNRYSHTGPVHAGVGGAAPSIPYLEVCFLVLVRDLIDAHAGASWFMPLVYIAPFRASAGDTSFTPTGDDASIIPTLTGREVYGFPKAPSRITYDVAGQDIALAELAVLLPIPTGELKYQTVFRIRRGACARGGGGVPTSKPPTPMRMRDLVGRFLDDAAWVDDPSRLVAALPDAARMTFDPKKYLGAPLLTLRQSRHPQSVRKACYQAVVSTPLDVIDEDLGVRVDGSHCAEFLDPGGLGLWHALGIHSAAKSLDSLDGYHLNTWLRFADPQRIVVLQAP